MNVVVLWEPAPHFSKQQLPPLRVVILQVIKDRSQAGPGRLQRLGIYRGRLSNEGEVQRVGLHPGEPLQRELRVRLRDGVPIRIVELPGYLAVFLMPLKRSNDELSQP